MYYAEQSIDDFHANQVAAAMSRAFSKSLLARGSSMLVSDLDVITQADLSRISNWNSVPSLPNESCLHWIFHAATKIFADSVAIVSWDGTMTYRELDEASSSLAHHLIDYHQCGPGVHVPICFEKSIWGVVSMLAVLKSGAAYCCLDPSHPTARHNFIISSLKSEFILTSKRQSALFPSFPKVVMDSFLASTLALGNLKSMPDTGVTPFDTCIIVWTSGSTGDPKGIVHSHMSICTGLMANASHQGLSETGQRVFQWTSYTFDVSISEIHVPLLHGGCLCIPSDDERLNNVQESMNRMQVDWAYFTPSYARFVQRFSIPTLKTLVMGGEAITTEDLKTWIGKYRVINAYGPAENAAWFCRDQKAQESKTISFGRLSTGYAWIVDAEDAEKLLPIGAIGELLVEGPTVFLQYLNDPDRTQKTLIDAPAWRKTAGVPTSHKVYKTGDLVKYLSDGSMTYIGRKDTMVKVRGQRIELEEVEVFLRRCLPKEADSGVDVVWRGGKSNDVALVAFVNLQNEVNDDWIDDLRAQAQAQLRKSLPEYMIPQIFLPMKALPYNASQKLDRKALRSYAASLPLEKLLRSRSKTALPTKGTDRSASKMEIFKGLWAQVLDIDVASFGQEDNFFHLGGDSITAMKLVALGRDQGLFFKLADVLGASSLRELSHRVETTSQTSAEDYLPLCLIDPPARAAVMGDALEQCGASENSVEDIMPLSPQQEGLWAVSLVQQGDYVCRFLLKLRPTVQIDKFCHAVAKVAENFPTLRTRFIRSGRNNYQVVLRHEFSLENGSSLSTYLTESSHDVVDFGKRLTKFAIISDESVQDAEQLRTLVWTSHHALYDGLNVSMILNAIADSYRGDKSDARAGFPYGLFLRSIKEIDHAAAVHYWQSQFAGLDVSCFPCLPNATYRPKATSVYSRTFPIPQTKRTSLTQATVIRAALSLTLSLTSETSNIVFGETISGRSTEIPHILDYTGPTFVTLPRPYRIQSSESVLSFLQQVQSVNLGMLPFQHVGMQKIRSLGPDCSKACQFQTLLLIETDEVNDYDDLFIFDENSVYTGGTQSFESHALVWKLYLSAHQLELRAIFDPDVLNENEVQDLARKFELCVVELSAAEDYRSLGSLWCNVMPTCELPSSVSKVSDQINDTPNTLSSAESDQEALLVEEKLKRVWSDVLQIELEAVRLDSNFFSVGGDSLMAMSFVADARGLGLTISVIDLVKHPILSDLISSVKESSGENSTKTSHIPLISPSQVKIAQDLAIKQARLDVHTIEKILTATPWQDSIMTLSQGWTGAMVAQYIIYVPREFSVATFKKTWDALAEYYSILRTRIVFSNKHGAFQIVVKGKIPWDRITDLELYLEQDRQNLMEFGDPLVRYAIQDNTGKDQRSVFVWTIHHALYDYFILQKLLSNAMGLLKGERLPPIVPYESFLQYLARFDQEAKRNFWSEQMESWCPHNFPSLPTSEYTASADAYYTESLEFPERGNSMFTTPTIVRAAWTLMVSQFTGHEDIVIHQALSGRNAPIKSATDIIGPMINLVPTRTSVKPDAKIFDWLEDIRSRAATLMPFEQTGLKEIKKYTQACQDACAFQNLLVIQFAGLETVSENIDTLRAEAGTESSDQLEIIDLLTNFKYFNVYGILYFCTLTPKGADISISYDAKMIDPDQMRRCVRHFGYLMNVLRSPTEQLENWTVADISGINPHDLDELESWNVDKSRSTFRPLHQVIESISDSNSGTFAFETRSCHLSYLELNELSSRLSIHLMNEGVTRETIVPLVFDRSIWAIVAALAVLKAGGAFMFLKPDHAANDKALDLVSARVVLRSHCESKSPHGCNVITIDHTMLEELPTASEFIQNDILPTDAAVVIVRYLPNGSLQLIVHDHLSLAISISSNSSFFGIDPGSRTLLASPSHSELMIQEAFVALAGCYHLHS